MSQRPTWKIRIILPSITKQCTCFLLAGANVGVEHRQIQTYPQLLPAPCESGEEGGKIGDDNGERAIGSSVRAEERGKGEEKTRGEGGGRAELRGC